MNAYATRLRRVLAAFLAGWSYTGWDPPYPGDGI